MIKNKSKASPPQQQISKLLDHFQSGRFSESETLAVTITRKYPEDQFGWKALGAIYGQTGRIHESLFPNKMSVQLAPQDAQAHYNLGITLRKLERLSEAETSYKKAIVLEPNHAEAHYNLGITLKEIGRLEEAEASYNKAIALKPDYADAYNNLGNTLKKLRRLEEAEASYKKAILLKPDFAEAHDNLGVTLKAQGRLEEAEALYKQALALKPDYTEAHNNLGNTLKELGRLDEAVASYKKAISLTPDFAPAFWNLSGCEKTVKDAEYWIDKCLKVDSNYLEAKLIKAALRYYQGDKANFINLMQPEFTQHPYMRSFSWVFSLAKLPELHFNRWQFFDSIVKKSIVSRPFYEFGVWRATSFKYLIKYFKKGYGFDTFTGLPEDWDTGNHVEGKGTYTSNGNVPEIAGGHFTVGKFEDTLPNFFCERRPMASVINLDSDLYSSTMCALNYSKSVMDKDTILIFDEFIINENWEQDEFKALNDFCSKYRLDYEVVSVSFFSKQVALKLIGI